MIEIAAHTSALEPAPAPARYAMLEGAHRVSVRAAERIGHYSRPMVYGVFAPMGPR